MRVCPQIIRASSEACAHNLHTYTHTPHSVTLWFCSHTGSLHYCWTLCTRMSTARLGTKMQSVSALMFPYANSIRHNTTAGWRTDLCAGWGYDINDNSEVSGFSTYYSGQSGEQVTVLVRCRLSCRVLLTSAWQTRRNWKVFLTRQHIG